MTDVTQGWQRAFPLMKLPVGGARLFRHGAAQIAVFRPDPDPKTGGPGVERIYAVDNRCPHEGYPLIQGSVRHEARGCVLTCQWHNYKFRLEDGACVVGEEGVRAWPVRLAGAEDPEGPWVEIDLTPPPSLIAGLWAELRAGLRRHETGRMARAAIRLLDLGIGPAELLTAAACHACDHGEYGISHGPALASELCMPGGLSPAAPPELQIAQALDLSARSALGNPPRPRPDPVDPGDDAGWAGRRLRAMVQAEQVTEAEALVRGAVARGWRGPELLPWFVHLCSDHFLDFGHMLIYTERIFAMLDQTGWAEADRLLGGLVFAIASGTREDLLPEWSAWRRQMEARRAAPGDAEPGADTPGADTPGADTPGAAPLPRNALIEADPARAFSLVSGALRSGHRTAALDALAAAAAVRMLRFDLAHDADPGVAEGWLDLTHR